MNVSKVGLDDFLQRFQWIPHKLGPAGTPCSLCKGSGELWENKQPLCECPDCRGTGREPETKKYEMCGICQHIEAYQYHCDVCFECKSTSYLKSVSPHSGCAQVELNTPACRNFKPKDRGKPPVKCPLGYGKEKGE